MNEQMHVLDRYFLWNKKSILLSKFVANYKNTSLYSSSLAYSKSARFNFYLQYRYYDDGPINFYKFPVIGRRHNVKWWIYSRNDLLVCGNPGISTGLQSSTPNVKNGWSIGERPKFYSPSCESWCLQISEIFSDRKLRNTY